MDRIELLHKLESLVCTEYQDDFRSHVSNLLKKYVEILGELDEDKRPAQWETIINNIQVLSKMIKECLKRVYMGQHSSAYNLFRKRMNEIIGFPGFVQELSEGMSFYRMRVYGDDVAETPNSKGLFHIPFDKRGIVKTERYSTPGYPCLYLGFSSYVCWEEMNRPNLDKCYVSKLRLDRKINVVNLALPEEVIWKNEGAVIGDLHRYPLIIASMVMVKNKKDTFKPEYIIPQLMMEWILEMQISKKREDPIYGAYYSSAHYKNGLDYFRLFFGNLAIPAISPFDGKLSKELCDMFSITEPTSEELENAKGALFDGSNIYMPITTTDVMAIKKQKYQRSLFGVLEKVLNNEKEYPLKKLDYK